MLTPAFHFNILDDFAATMKRHGSMLVEEIERNPEKCIVDIVELITFQSLAETSFGAHFETTAEASVFFNSMATIIEQMVSKSLNPINKWDWYFSKTAGKSYC